MVKSTMISHPVEQQARWAIQNLNQAKYELLRAYEHLQRMNDSKRGRQALRLAKHLTLLSEKICAKNLPESG